LPPPPSARPNTYDADRREASTTTSRRSRTEALDRYDRERDRERARRYDRDDRGWFPVKDLRLTIGQAPGPDTISVDRFTGTTGSTIDFDADGEQMTGGALTFSYGRLHPGGGLIVATGVDLYQGSVTATIPGAAGSVDFDVERFGALIKFGYGVPFTDALHLEVLPYLDVGFASASAQGGSGGSMVMGQVGLEAGLYYRFGLGRAGLVGGWNYFSGWGDTTMRGSGPQYGINVGFAF
jgi:hypothetical protein